MTKTTFFPFIFHAGITVSLTCSHYSRYPVCALKKDSAGFGDLPAILQFAQRRPSCLKQPYSLIQELTVTIFCQ